MCLAFMPKVRSIWSVLIPKLMNDLTLDLLWFCKASGTRWRNVGLASPMAATIPICIDLHPRLKLSFWMSRKRVILRISFNLFVICFIFWPVAFWPKLFWSGKLRWVRSMRLSLRATMDYGGISWMTSSRSPDSLQGAPLIRHVERKGCVHGTISTWRWCLVFH